MTMMPKQRRLPVLGPDANEASRMAVYAPFDTRPAGWGERGLPPLTDANGRGYRYLRLSVTDRCDMACVYCMPPGGEEEHALRREVLTFEEAGRLVRIAAEMGIRRVRLTGGEPLVRKDIVRLVQLIHDETAVDEIVMTTNASRLAQLAVPLAEAGLAGINVSLDSLDPERFARITRGGDLGAVLAGIHAARAAGMHIKLNTVALRGRNDDELGRIVDFAWSIGAVPRFIELMPLGEGAKLPAGTAMTAADVQAALGDRIGDGGVQRGGVAHGPARYLTSRDGDRVGFITPLSNEFCDDCNRIRVTARGDLRACLASRRAVSLRDEMRREGAVDADVAWALVSALGAKADGHGFNAADITEHENVGMSLIGG